MNSRLAIHIGATLDEHLDLVDGTIIHGHMQWRLAVEIDVRLGAGVDQ